MSILFSIKLVKYNVIKSLFFHYITPQYTSEYYIMIDLELSILYCIYYDVTTDEKMSIQHGYTNQQGDFCSS